MSEQVSHKSEWRKMHRDEQGPSPDDEHDSEWIPYIPWLEAKLSKMETYKKEVEEVAEIMFQFTMKRLNEAGEVLQERDDEHIEK